jgi:hypothetical protein
MKRKTASPRRRDARRTGPSGKVLLWVVIAGPLAILAGVLLSRNHRTTARTMALANQPLTFYHDVAPIIYNRCAPCHHPGQAAPFDLLSYADVQKHARQIRSVVEQRIMPPWLPDAADGPFLGQRSLSTEQIATIQHWVEQGEPEGSASDAPIAPKWVEGWQLGTPDLVIRMAEPYGLPADGPDVYRSFVIPIPNTSKRFVKGIELQPGNPRIVHHAFMRIDATDGSKRRDAQDPGPGFGGLHTPVSARTPEGQFLSWQPGKLHTFVPRGLAWILETNCDLVLQLHLRPSGKPEVIQSSVGFYFTDEAPTNTPFKIGLQTFAIDIPAGASAHPVRESYTLAADVEVLSVLPHAHYLGRDMQAIATLPDGKQQRLLHIANWDFNWQGEYLYEKPIFLPKGTTLSMVYLYDNSTNNARNPNQPPQRVRYGLQSTDEMAELWLQVLPRNAQDFVAMTRYDQPRVFRSAIAYNQFLLGLNPDDSRAHNEVGRAKLFLGQYGEAEASLRRAVALDPAFDEPHYFLGVLFRMHNRLADAATEFGAAVRNNPDNARAHGSLGIVLLGQGQNDEAESHLRTALRLDPQDEIAKETLEQIAASRREGSKKK